MSPLPGLRIRPITSQIAGEPAIDFVLTHESTEGIFAAAARRIEAVDSGALAAGEVQTADIGGRASTREATQAILCRIA